MKALIRWGLRHIPRTYLQRLAPIVSPILAVFYRGKRFYCPICLGRWRQLLPYGRQALRPNALCPQCHSLERHRLMWLYLRDQTELFERPHRLLHIAPEACFLPRFRAMRHLEYLTADLESPWADVKMDICSMPFASNSFDVILCNHVLEHIDDDRRALAEIYRVLRPGGWALLQVPINYQLAYTYENPTIRLPEEREKHFGQRDHVRLYGRDYPQRLQQAGFRVEENHLASQLPPDTIKKMALSPHEILYIAYKG